MAFDSVVFATGYRINVPSWLKGNNNMRKDACRVIGNPTDSLIETSLPSNSKSEETSGGSGKPKPKSILQSSSVIVSVTKKPRLAPTDGEQLLDDKHRGGEGSGSKPPETNTGLLSLCQNYDSDDE